MEKLKKKLSKEIKEVCDMVNKKNIPLGLSKEIHAACSNVLEGKDIEEILTAFLVLAFEMKMSEMEDYSDRDEINKLCEFMKAKSACVFYTLGASMTVYSIIRETTDCKNDI